MVARDTVSLDEVLPSGSPFSFYDGEGETADFSLAVTLVSSSSAQCAALVGATARFCPSPHPTSNLTKYTVTKFVCVGFFLVG
jgi:purine-cytosine permease-like protein